MSIIAAPNAPINVRVYDIQCDSLTFCWDLPLENPQCVYNYDTHFRPLQKLSLQNENGKQGEEADYCLIYNNLALDTDYYFEVWFYSESNQSSDHVAIVGRTLPICI